MNWTKHGLIYYPGGHFWWNKSHAQMPTVDAINDRMWRIYFGSRDEQNRTRIGYVEVEAGRPDRILYEHDTPVLDIGRIGTFDACGAMPAWILTHQGLKYTYYVGWTVRKTVPFHNSVGLAISEDGGHTFRKPYKGPLFGTTLTEPYFTSALCVRVENGIWRSWYLSITEWRVFNGKPEPCGHIKYAESKDGINWKRDGVVAVDYKCKEEGAIARPTVIHEDGIYKMWYCYRNANDFRGRTPGSYRIGYAESLDGISWKRMDDKVDLDVSDDGWDSEMLCYGQIVPFGDKKYLIYNGNGFGRSGFGYAVLG